MTTTDVTTTYPGLPLTNPFTVGVSPLTDHLDTVRRLEDAGCAAIVLHSLFEEQITQADTGRVHEMHPSILVSTRSSRTRRHRTASADDAVVVGGIGALVWMEVVKRSVSEAPGLGNG